MARRKRHPPDPHQRLLPLARILDEEPGKVEFRQVQNVPRLDEDDPRSTAGVDWDKVAVYRGPDPWAKEPRSSRRAGAQWGLEFHGDPIPLARYTIHFHPDQLHFERLKVQITGERADAEQEAERLRKILRLPVQQYLLQDGDLVAVWEFLKTDLRWHLRWRKNPDGTVDDRSLSD